MNDQGQSSFSSDPGSAIEGFGQKIPLHNELTDLGMQLRQFRVPVLLACIALLVEDLGEPASRFQAAIWVGCSSYLVASSATVWWPLIASSATLALNSAENRLRVLMVDRPLRRQIHLNRLSQEVGPPLTPKRSRRAE